MLHPLFAFHSCPTLHFVSAHDTTDTPETRNNSSLYSAPSPCTIAIVSTHLSLALTLSNDTMASFGLVLTAMSADSEWRSSPDSWAIARSRAQEKLLRRWQ